MKFFIIICLFLPQISHGTLQWSPILPIPSSIETNGIKVAVNKKHCALLVWHQKNESRILSSTYHFIEKQWSSPIEIDSQFDDIKLLAIYFNDQSEKGVLWYDQVTNSLSLSYYNSQGWTSPLTIKLVFQIQDPQSLFDSKGNLIVVWSAWNGLEKIIQGLFYSKELGNWSSISDLSPIGMSCEKPKIAINENGLGIAAWESQYTQEGASQAFIQAVIFNPSQFTWEKPICFGYDWLNTYLANPDVIVDGDNNIAIIWEKKRMDQLEESCLQYVRYLAKKNLWTYVSERDEKGALNPQFLKNSLGPQVFWNVETGPDQGLYLAEFDIENNQWNFIHRLIQTGKGIEQVKAIHDPLGKQNLAWLNQNILQIAHFDKMWMPTVHLDKYPHTRCFDFANDSMGNVILILIHQKYLMYSIGNYLLPPDFFSVKKVEVRYPSRKINHGYLRWNHAESPNAMSYIVRRNGVIQAILPVHVQQYTDYRCPFDPVSYELSIVNIDNIESHPVKREL